MGFDVACDDRFDNSAAEYACTRGRIQKPYPLPSHSNLTGHEISGRYWSQIQALAPAHVIGLLLDIPRTDPVRVLGGTVAIKSDRHWRDQRLVGAPCLLSQPSMDPHAEAIASFWLEEIVSIHANMCLNTNTERLGGGLPTSVRLQQPFDITLLSTSRQYCTVCQVRL